MTGSLEPATRAEAEEIAISAITYVARDQRQLERFLRLTGWTPAALRAEAGRSALLAGVLEYMMADESLLVAFAADAGLEPQRIAAASHILQEAHGRGKA